jgi:hypothetical protein
MGFMYTYDDQAMNINRFLVVKPLRKRLLESSRKR